jgi:hypothetical protein
MGTFMACYRDSFTFFSFTITTFEPASEKLKFNTHSSWRLINKQDFLTVNHGNLNFTFLENERMIIWNVRKN